MLLDLLLELHFKLTDQVIALCFDFVLPGEQLAAYLKAGKRTVYRLAQKGEIPAFKLGGTWRFRRSELDRWIAESINKTQPKTE